MICNVRVCTMVTRKWNGAKCAFAYHDSGFFGLSRTDYVTIHGKKKENWSSPTTTIMSRNSRRMRTFLDAITEESKKDDSVLEEASA